MRLLIALAIFTGIIGCATGITREDLLKQLQEGYMPLIVDVRSQKEYDRDHVPGAIHISFISIGSGLREQGHTGAQPVVLYCEHGPRAGIAGLSLFLAGYEHIYSLDGHMKGWRAAGFPLEIINP